MFLDAASVDPDPFVLVSGRLFSAFLDLEKPGTSKFQFSSLPLFLHGKLKRLIGNLVLAPSMGKDCIKGSPIEEVFKLPLG